MDVDISGLCKADVLAALYNASQPLGLGWLSHDPDNMTHEEAQRILDAKSTNGPTPIGGFAYFDYLKGRVMKVDISGETVNAHSFDLDNGPGALKQAIDNLRNSLR